MKVAFQPPYGTFPGHIDVPIWGESDVGRVDSKEYLRIRVRAYANCGMLFSRGLEH